MISNGVIVSGGLVRESVLSPGVRVDSWAQVERSVILHNTRIGQHSVVRNAILDKNVAVPAGATVGVDKEQPTRPAGSWCPPAGNGRQGQVVAP